MVSYSLSIYFMYCFKCRGQTGETNYQNLPQRITEIYEICQRIIGRGAVRGSPAVRGRGGPARFIFNTRNNKVPILCVIRQFGM